MLRKMIVYIVAAVAVAGVAAGVWLTHWGKRLPHTVSAAAPAAQPGTMSVPEPALATSDTAVAGFDAQREFGTNPPETVASTEVPVGELPDDVSAALAEDTSSKAGEASPYVEPTLRHAPAGDGSPHPTPKPQRPDDPPIRRETPTKAVPPPLRSAGAVHRTVEPGDTAWSLAREAGTNLVTVAVCSNRCFRELERLRPGTELTVSCNLDAARLAAWRVRRGQTLQCIAAVYRTVFPGMTAEALASANHMTTNDVLFAWRRLVVPAFQWQRAGVQPKTATRFANHATP